MRREVDEDKLRQVEEYVDKQINLTEYVKMRGYKIQGGVMSCPFHGSDSTPSLRINDNKWKCFGCGRGGKYVMFRHEENLLENAKATYYDAVEAIVRENNPLAVSIGGTIFKTHEQSAEEAWDEMLETATTVSYKPKRVKVDSYDILIRKAKKQDVDIQMRLLSGIQNELPYNVLKNIVEGTDLTGKTLLDLAFGS